MTITFTYINWRGTFGVRQVEVYGIFFGSTEYHSESQWLLRGLDLEKKQERVFAMKDMSSVRTITGDSPQYHLIGVVD